MCATWSMHDKNRTGATGWLVATLNDRYYFVDIFAAYRSFRTVCNRSDTRQHPPCLGNPLMKGRCYSTMPSAQIQLAPCSVAAAMLLLLHAATCSGCKLKGKQAGNTQPQGLMAFRRAWHSLVARPIAATQPVHLP